MELPDALRATLTPWLGAVNPSLVALVVAVRVVRLLPPATVFTVGAKAVVGSITAGMKHFSMRRF